MTSWQTRGSSRPDSGGVSELEGGHDRRALLDTARELETPEGIELNLRVAGAVPRSLAWATDSLIRIAVYIVLSMVLLPLGRFGSGVFLIVLFLLEWFYPVAFEVLGNGATPGKRLLGLCVLHDNGTPVGWSASVVRNLLRFVDFLPLLYAFGLVSMLLHRDFKRLGDLAAGTIVVYREYMPRAAERGQSRALAPAYPLLPEEQQALVDFAERQGQLTAERAGELAALSGPLVRGAPDPAAYLTALANWVAGQR
jgi:uncharacterized RDD family membrane protein YckC